MRVSICWAGPQGEIELALQLSASARVADALDAARADLSTSNPALAAAIDWDGANVGIYGEQRERSAALREGDRVEIYRPLLLDPKETRRARARQLKLKPALRR